MCFEYLECITPVRCLSKVFLCVATFLRIYREKKCLQHCKIDWGLKVHPMLTGTISLWVYTDLAFTCCPVGCAGSVKPLPADFVNEALLWAAGAWGPCNDVSWICQLESHGLGGECRLVWVEALQVEAKCPLSLGVSSSGIMLRYFGDPVVINSGTNRGNETWKYSLIS